MAPTEEQPADFLLPDHLQEVRVRETAGGIGSVFASSLAAEADSKQKMVGPKWTEEGLLGKDPQDQVNHPDEPLHLRHDPGLGREVPTREPRKTPEVLAQVRWMGGVENEVGRTRLADRGRARRQNRIQSGT
jgi:hypothetical protein